MTTSGRQKPDGGFSEDPAATVGRAYETAAVYLALAEAQRAGNAAAIGAQPVRDSALTFLVAAQRADGSWEGEPLATGLALQALPPGALADSDGDGIPDVVEQLLGTNPNVADAHKTAPGGGRAIPGLTTPIFSLTALLNQPLSYTISPTGGTPPYNNFSIVSGGLPNGISLAAGSGVLSGTPSVAGAFNFTYQAQDSQGRLSAAPAQVTVTVPSTFRELSDPLALDSLTPFQHEARSGMHVVWEDLDGDGDLDLAAYVLAASDGLLVFENIDGTYVRRPLAADVDRLHGDILSIYAVDYDNDGKRDLVFALRDANAGAGPGHRPIVVYRNTSTTALAFADVTNDLGLAVAADFPGAETIVLDANQDGHPDFVNSHQLWIYDKTARVYRDRFAESNLPAGLGRPVALDFDRDGKIDYATFEAATGLRFFRNNGNGAFTELANTSALAGLIGAATRQILPGDIDGDGRVDFVLVETGHPPGAARLRFLRNRGAPSVGEVDFAEEQLTGVALPVDPADHGSRAMLIDYNNDGRTDALLATQTGGALLRNDGANNFAPLANETGIRAGERQHTPAAADFNDDGKIDLILPTPAADYMFVNTSEPPQHALIIDLVGNAATSGTDAIGARVEVVAGGVTQMQQVVPSFGLPLRRHFGIGAAASAQVRVYWPSGAVSPVTTVTAVDRRLTIREP